jgi:hypothetical protein
VAHEDPERIGCGERPVLLIVMAQGGGNKRSVVAGARFEAFGNVFEHGEHLLARVVRTGMDGARYKVTAWPRTMVDPDLIDTCVASHLAITYKYIKIRKDGFPQSVKIEEVDGSRETLLHILKTGGKPNCTSANAENERRNPFETEFSVEIHNEN